MRLHRLELEGFGPFRDRQVVDFDAYADDGIFLISGRTGAGKSSILDGVCFALYGGVPRYGAGEKRLRSDHAAVDDVTEVSLELTVADRRLRVTRSPLYERAKRRGTGTTPIPARATLDECVDGVWQGLAARPVDVAAVLHEVLGLTQEQFLQVVLLAQNRFAEFLLAKPDDRRGVLQTLFGSRRYRDYAAEVDERRKAAEERVAQRAEKVRRLVDDVLRGGDVVPTGDDLDAGLEAAGLAVARADYRAEACEVRRTAAAADFDAAEREHRALSALADRLAARGRSRAALAVLEEGAAAVTADRARLAAALDAEELRAALSAADLSASAGARAATALRAAQAALADPSDADDPAALVESLGASLAAWRSALAREQELAVLDMQRDEAGERLATLVAADGELAAQRSAIPPRVTELDTRLADDRGVAARVAPAIDALAELEVRAAAAADADRLAQARDRAERARADALAESAEAVSVLTALLRRRLAGHAAELAAGLVEGEACLVCGATAHPHPATAAAAPVTDDDVSDAEARKERTGAAEAVATAAAHRAHDEHAAAAARAGGATADELRDHLSLAAADLAAARAAAGRVAADDAERAALLALADETDRERAAVAIDIAARRDELARLDERRSAALVEVAAARGDHTSVAGRIAAAESRRHAAQTVLAVSREVERCSAASATAAEALVAAVAVSGFADAAAARAALLEPDTTTALAERIAVHETSVRLERERLLALELELVDAADGPVDLAAAAARRQAARDAWTAAIDEASRAAQEVRRLRELLARATEAHAGIADLAREAAVVARLAHTLAGRAPNTHRMDLETFVLAAELEEIVRAANLRLAEMSSGRFRLVHTDALAARGAASGLGLDVLDAFTGTARPTASLSGGERFLASLALALGLAEVVTARAGGLRLDTLFVDEGFGSLDGDTLELAMHALDELRQGGRTVGVISHVEAMKEQLTAQLHVEALPGGPSVVRQGASVGV